MATIVVETGSVVPGANSFVDLAAVTAYAAAYQPDSDWDATDVAEATGALLRAANYLANEQRYVYRGARLAYDQTMPWPRTGATEYRGPAIPSTAIPWRVQRAQCMLALREYTSPGSLQPDLARGGKVTSEKVDVIETSYAPDAPVETLISEVQGVLQPLLMTAGAIPMPYVAYTPTPDAFTDLAFSNPPGSDPDGES